mgnify:FL=1
MRHERGIREDSTGSAESASSLRRIGRALAARPARLSPARHVGRVALGTFLTGTGIAHLTALREEFQAQVPPWFPADPDAVVVVSGVAEIAIGLSLVALPRWRVPVGAAAAAFFVVIFPGNISQYVTGTDAFGLDSDGARLVRLFFQPALVAWALWSTGAWRALASGLRGPGPHSEAHS